MNAITVQNLRITPFSQKDSIPKIVYSDDWSITIKLPTPHQTGDKYAIGLDYENTLYPPNRPLCAGSELYVLNDDELTFTLKLATARLRDWCSKLKKPMPIAIQIVRIRDNKAETLLLDTLLALPSVFDGVVTVYEGDALDERLDEKMDNPPTEGEAGQVLGINEDGQIVWMTIEIPEQVQSDWDESDTESPAYIANKPVIPIVNDGKITVNQGGVKKGEFTVNQSGDTVIELNDGAQSNWDESDSSDVSFIKNKPSIPSKTSDLTNDSDFQTGTQVSTAISTAIADKADKATTLAGYGITDAYTKTEVDSKVASVFHYKGSVQTYADLPATGQEVGDVYNVVTADTTHGIKAGDNVAWTGTAWDVLAGEIDLSAYATKTELATKLDEPAVAGTVGQVLTKTADGQEWADTVVEEMPDYLCFTNTYNGTNTVKIVLVDNPTPASLEFSKDGENWTQVVWSNGESQTVTLANGEKVYFRGDNPNFSYGQWNSSLGIDIYHKFVLGQPSVCSGSILSLFSKDCKYEGAIRVNRLFQECLITTPPKLSANVQSYGYKQLFWNCTSLEYAPELPAVNLGTGCYDSMFDGCTSLHVAPELPATIMQNNCYKSMFKGCTSLTKAPYLPATSLATECYAYMFEGCTSLSDIPARLPATTLAEKCYSNMFKSCSSLRKPPVLPATVMAVSCYENMFNATDLREVPELPATELALQCYGGMFIGCSNLERIPLNYLQAMTMQVGCYQWMFVNCVSLKVGCRLPATVMKSQCYAHMYDGCTSLVDSERIDATTLANGCMNQMFKGCTNLTRLWIPNMTAFDESATPAWMSGLSNLKRAFVCNANLDTSVRNENRIPAGWIPTRNAYAGDAMVPRWGIYSNNITFAPTNSEQDLITVNKNITLNAIELPYGYVGTAQAFINWTWTGVTLTAGEGIDFVDTPRERYLSRVLITWDGTGNAKLRVMWETAL